MKIILSGLLLVMMTSSAWATASSEDSGVTITPKGSIKYEVPSGNPDLQCGDDYGTYFIFNIKDLKKVSVVEKRAQSIMAVPLQISKVKVTKAGASFHSVYNIGIAVEGYDMKLDLGKSLLKVFSEKSQKTYEILCEAFQE